MHSSSALFESYISTAISVISIYDETIPLPHFLKQFYKQNKKYGSRDRKIITELIFGYYRMGKTNLFTIREQCIVGSYLSNSSIYTYYYPEWPSENRLDYIKNSFINFNLQSLGQYLPVLSEGIVQENYFLSLLQKPSTFIRIRKNKKIIINSLNEKEIQHTFINDSTIAFPQKVDLDKLLPDIENYVVQDISSQLVCTHFKPQPNEIWWDACAASGGKSIGLLDTGKKIELYVSDLRASILSNLDTRFKKYGLRYSAKSVLNLEVKQTEIFDSVSSPFFDAIIVDAPCSGSGTWARSPEQFFFYKNTVASFHQKQVLIIKNAIVFLKPGGTLYYITCSAFRQENEDVVDAILKSHPNLQLEYKQVIDSANLYGDIMFIAVLQKIE